jgi:superfamily II DNA or RNA helicase
MGLGKTLTCIAAISAIMTKKPTTKVLIICPNRLVDNWDREFRKWCKCATLSLTTRRDMQDGNLEWWNDMGGIWILSAETFRCRYDQLKLQPEIAIVDEAHLLKNQSSQTWKSVASFSCPKILLSGTPLQNRIEEYVVMVSLADSEILSNCSIKYGQIEQGFTIMSTSSEVAKSRALLKLFTEITAPCIDRQSEEVLEDFLPQKTEYGIRYDAFVTEENESDSIFVSRYKQLEANESQVSTLAFTLMKSIHGKNKGAGILVFSRRPDTLKAIMVLLQEDGVPCFFMDGTTKTDSRNTYIQEFESTPKDQICVFLLTTGVGNVGLNFVRANYVLLLDPSWNPQEDRQAVARSYRLGQKNDVVVYRFFGSYVTHGTQYSNNSIEDYILKLHCLKSNLADRIVDDNPEVSVHLNRQSIESMRKDELVLQPVPVSTDAILEKWRTYDAMNAVLQIFNYDSEIRKRGNVTEREKRELNEEYKLLRLYTTRRLFSSDGTEYLIPCPALGDITQGFFPDKLELVPPYRLIPALKEDYVEFHDVRPMTASARVEYQFLFEKKWHHVKEITNFTFTPKPKALKFQCTVASLKGKGIYRFRARVAFDNGDSTLYSKWSEQSDRVVI